MAERNAAPRKSDRTRAAILSAAREQFAANTYDKVSIRAIAAQAGVDPALVMRYFTNKETLFACAVNVDLRLPDLRSEPPTTWGAVHATHFIDLWEGPDRNEALPILIRSAVTHEWAAERAREIFTVQIRGMLESTMPADEAGRRAALAGSQLLGLALARYVLRLPGIAERPAAEIIADVAPTLQRYLTADLP